MQHKSHLGDSLLHWLCTPYRAVELCQASVVQDYSNVTSFCRGTEELVDGWSLMFPGLRKVSLSSSLW